MDKAMIKEFIARRVAKELKDGDVVNLTAKPLRNIGGEAYTTIVDGKVVYQK